MGASLTQVLGCWIVFQKNLTVLVGVLVMKEDEGRAQDNLNIEPQGPVVQVVESYSTRFSILSRVSVSPR